MAGYLLDAFIYLCAAVDVIQHTSMNAYFSLVNYVKCHPFVT